MESDGAASIGSVSAAEGVSARHARRRVAEAMGITPKGFAQIRRVRRACVDAFRTETNWSDVSLQAGFADQAHLARAFRDVFSLCPSEVRAFIRSIDHGDIYSA
jgi:AraC-like DNA-binding protein